MRRFPRASTTLLVPALALLLAAAAPGAAQESPDERVRFDAFGAVTTLAGEVFQWEETGPGFGGLARYRWPDGLSAGLGGRVSFPEVEIPRDGTLQDFTATEIFAEADYSFLRTGVARPFVGLRLGVVDVTRDVTLPPDAPIFGERPLWMATDQEGSGFAYGLVIGSELHVADGVALRVAATGARFDVSGFEALTEEGGRDAASETLGLEAGVSVSLGGAEADADGDGVPDARDRCPDTPAEVANVDPDGCATDSDGDGVPDHRDACPDTPSNAEVDASGCAVDSDGDGVPDGVDACPDTPSGAAVDREGCAVDTDDDGVSDPSDACPDSPAGEDVDEGGCTRIQRGLLEGSVVLEDVTFRGNSAQLTLAGREALGRVGRALLSMPGLEVEIGAHVDGQGEVARTVTERRAEAVLERLLELHPELDPGRFTTRGYGGARPLVEGGGADAVERNERVELRVTGEGGEDAGPG